MSVCVGVGVVFINLEPCCAELCHVHPSSTLLCVRGAQPDVNLSEDLQLKCWSLNVFNHMCLGVHVSSCTCECVCA